MLRLPRWPLIALVARVVHAGLEVNLEDTASIKSAAALVAQDLFDFYPGTNTPGWTIGILPGPPPNGDYYWWQAGAMWGTFLDYRQATGDKSFDQWITQSMLAQVGEDRDFMPSNWSASMGNDDQAFWAISALRAAEIGYADPPADQPQWLALAQAAFNEQTHMERRVHNATSACHGALRWQVFAFNNGWDYINTISQACYFNIGARLARYTGNTTYMTLVNETWQMTMRLKFIDDEWNVYDGAHEPKDCKDINKAQFSYNAAFFLQGLGFLYNLTDGDSYFASQIDPLLDQTLAFFFPDGIAKEIACEIVPGQSSCTTDMKSFKGYLHRWLSSLAQVAPYTANKILPVLKTSARAAVRQCTGGANGRMCGYHWTSGAFDGETGAGQEMNVLAALISLLGNEIAAPLTNTTGGTSVGNVNAGNEQDVLVIFTPITGGDRAGAGILTVTWLLGALGMFAWMNYN